MRHHFSGSILVQSSATMGGSAPKHDIQCRRSVIPSKLAVHSSTTGLASTTKYSGGKIDSAFQLEARSKAKYENHSDVLQQSMHPHEQSKAFIYL